MPDETVRDGEGGGKWTPGPWVYEHRQDSFDGMFYTQVFTPDNGEAVATVHWYPEQKPYGVTGTHREANARLIAAAPEMLEALERVRYICKIPLRDYFPTDAEMADSDFIYPLDQADQAIARAKGESNE